MIAAHASLGQLRCLHPEWFYRMRFLNPGWACGTARLGVRSFSSDITGHTPLSFRAKQADSFSSRLVPARRSARGPEESLFGLDDLPLHALPLCFLSLTRPFERFRNLLKMNTSFLLDKHYTIW
jgi:hypothetical protein